MCTDSADLTSVLLAQVPIREHRSLYALLCLTLFAYCSPAAAQPIANGAAQTNGHVTASPAVGRPYTVSITVPGSVIDNTQTVELATAVAGQIARTAAIFNIDEVIVIDDCPAGEPGSVGAGAAFLARVLQFMETPQYLRKYVPALAWLL